MPVKVSSIYPEAHPSQHPFSSCGQLVNECSTINLQWSLTRILSPKPQVHGQGIPCVTRMDLFSPLISLFVFDHSLCPVPRSSTDKTDLRWFFFSFSSWSELPLALFSSCLPVLVLGEKVNNHSLFTFLFPFYLYHLPHTHSFSRDEETQSVLSCYRCHSVLCW